MFELSTPVVKLWEGVIALPLIGTLDSGRPHIAQTMVHLGVEFGDIATKATLADALAHAFRQLDIMISPRVLHA